MEPTFKNLAELDRLIHEPARLAILTALSSCRGADFLYLQRLQASRKGTSRAGDIDCLCRSLADSRNGDHLVYLRRCGQPYLFERCVGHYNLSIQRAFATDLRDKELHRSAESLYVSLRVHIKWQSEEPYRPCQSKGDLYVRRG